jgi:transcription antitermination factor NusG
VRPRWESSTALLLTGKGYPTLLPTYRKKARREARRKEINPPLFPGYVFCQFDPLKRLPILITPGVIAVVSCGRIPLPVADGEIAAIQTIITCGVRAEPWPYLEVGQRVRVFEGSFEGLEGILIQFKGNQRIVVSISLLRRSVAVEFENYSVRPLASAPAAAQDPIALPVTPETAGLGRASVRGIGFRAGGDGLRQEHGGASAGA